MLENIYREIIGTSGGVKTKFILSINDLLEMREVFKDFKIKAVQLKYSVSKEALTEGKELLVSNI